MNLDIRLPMGAMFTVEGLIITIYGLMTQGDEKLYAHSLGMNVNLNWGLFMTAFGLFFLMLTWNAARAQKKK